MSRQPTPADLLPGRQVVTDDEAGDALRTLATSTDAIARARGRMVRTEHMLKHIKALMVVGGDGSISKRENDAMASSRYAQAIEEHVEAVIEFERLKAEREANTMLIEAWRTASSNNRSARF